MSDSCIFYLKNKEIIEAFRVNYKYHIESRV